MSKMILPMELYHAAKETCLRLYVANGGNPKDAWVIKPYPGTAAIAVRDDMDRWGNPRRQWTLCMPMMPLDVRLPKWKSDLIGAYTVHELLHSLWTDWDVVKTTRAAGLHGLCNALEDCRIEAKATRGELLLVNEARRLLMALNAHIARRALNTPGFALDAPEQFSFVLGLVIFAEKLGYVSELPVDWRSRVRPEWSPLFKLALDRFDALGSTADVFKLAQDLKALAASLPKAKPVKKPPASAPDQPGRPGGDKPPAGAPGPTGAPEREIVEEEPEDEEPEDEEPAHDDGAGPGEPEDMPEPPPPPRPVAGFEDEAEYAPKADEPEADEPEEDRKPAMAGDQGGRGGGRSEPEPEPEPEAAEDLTDATQVYAEANLDDLSQEAAKDAGLSQTELLAENMHASTVLNVPLPRRVDIRGGGNPKLASGAIASPARLRRHLTAAVKSPERVAVDRRQVSGRLDMRNLVGLSTGAPNVFKRRVEEEGREAAVSLTIDVSGSMAGARIAAAKALALHMGDALKAAGVKFEVAAWDDVVEELPKSFAHGWANDTQRAVAGLRCRSGTGMLPAMKAAAERLLKVGNVTRRILMVLTDGADSYAPEANAALCKFYAGRGVEIVGIGLQTHGMARSFNGKAIEVWSTTELSEKGLAQLVRVLDAGAARTA